MTYRERGNSETNFLLMLIKWVDGVAYRIELLDPVMEKDWWDLTAERRCVVLGWGELQLPKSDMLISYP
jgi:hypothetical protein